MAKLPVLRDKFTSGFVVGLVIPVLWVVSTSAPALSSDHGDQGEEHAQALAQAIEIDQVQLAEQESAILGSLGWDENGAVDDFRSKAEKILEVGLSDTELATDDSGPAIQILEEGVEAVAVEEVAAVEVVAEDIVVEKLSDTVVPEVLVVQEAPVIELVEVEEPAAPLAVAAKGEALLAGIEVLEEERSEVAPSIQNVNQVEQNIVEDQSGSIDSSIEIVSDEDESGQAAELQVITHSTVGEQLQEVEAEKEAVAQQSLDELAAQNQAILATLVADYQELEREASALLELDLFYERDEDMTAEPEVQVAQKEKDTVTPEKQLSADEMFEFAGPEQQVVASNLPIAAAEAEDVPLAEVVAEPAA